MTAPPPLDPSLPGPGQVRRRARGSGGRAAADPDERLGDSPDRQELLLAPASRTGLLPTHMGLIEAFAAG